KHVEVKESDRFGNPVFNSPALTVTGNNLQDGAFHTDADWCAKGFEFFGDLIRGALFLPLIWRKLLIDAIAFQSITSQIIEFICCLIEHRSKKTVSVLNLLI
ncbi:MAG: hypothetical protein JXA71_10085, partial [Chitinispirillaceae bacterium]|nr:hypothetical protein [Chitinispirillaceae bacterium]